MNQQMDSKRSRLSRRNALLALGGVVAAAGVMIATPFRRMIATRTRTLLAGTPVARRPASFVDASYDQWAQAVGSVFAVGGGVSLRLAGVRPMTSSGPRPANVRPRAFLAAFDPVGNATMAGDLIYSAVHPIHGAMQMFLQASPDPRTPARMLAVFD